MVISGGGKKDAATGASTFGVHILAHIRGVGKSTGAPGAVLRIIQASRQAARAHRYEVLAFAPTAAADSKSTVSSCKTAPWRPYFAVKSTAKEAVWATGSAVSAAAAAVDPFELHHL